MQTGFQLVLILIKGFGLPRNRLDKKISEDRDDSQSPAECPVQVVEGVGGDGIRIERCQAHARPQVV